jgi:hypothetical protein
MNDVDRFISLAADAHKIMHGPGTWQEKYEAIFSDSVCGEINRTRMLSHDVAPSLPYHPDNWEADVRRCCDTLRLRAHELYAMIVGG